MPADHHPQQERVRFWQHLIDRCCVEEPEQRPTEAELLRSLNYLPAQLLKTVRRRR